MAVLAVTGLWVFSMEEKTVERQNNADYKIVNIDGTEVRLPRRPQRVAVLTTASMETWVAAGGGAQIIARPKDTMAPASTLAKVNKDAVDIGASGRVSIENVIRQNPDLVIGSAMLSVQNMIVQPLNAAKIPLLAFPNYSIDEICQEIALCGELTGNEQMAQQEIKRIKDNIEKEAQRRGNTPKKRVLLIWGTPVSFSMALPHSRQGDVLRLAGGENIAVNPGTDARFIPFSLEYAVKEDPDYVLFMTHGKREKVQSQMEKTLAESSAWQEIRAVREGRAVVLPPELFALNPGPRIDEAVVFLSRLIYPDSEMKK